MDADKKINDSWELLTCLNDMKQDSISFSIDQILEVAQQNQYYFDFRCCSVLLSEFIGEEEIKANIPAYKKIIELCQPFYHDLHWTDRFKYELIEQIIEGLN